LRPAPDQIARKLAAVARRYAADQRDRMPKGRPRWIVLRIAQLRRLLADRYGPQLPDDDAGREDARIMVNHLALRGGRQTARMLAWLDGACPWMTAGERAELVDTAADQPQRWTPDQLAERLNLLEADRRRLEITTIGAVDVTREQRLALRRERSRLARQEQRRAAGRKPRADYLQECKAKPRPWQAAGISRSLWYRIRKNGPQAQRAAG
jgi:hypothetical protein